MSESRAFLVCSLQSMFYSESLLRSETSGHAAEQGGGRPSFFCTQWHPALVPLFFLGFCNGNCLTSYGLPTATPPPHSAPMSPYPTPRHWVSDFSAMPGHLLLIHPVFTFQILFEILTLLFFLLVGLSFFIPLLLFLERNKHMYAIPRIQSEVQ